MHYQFDPVQTTKTSVHGAINMLGLAKRTRAKMLQASTCEVYGDPSQHPQTEDYWGNVNPIGPRACYDEGKRCAETLFFDYHRQHKLRIKVARIFNTYGPRMHPNDGRVVSNFIVQALRGEPITLYGEGSQTRALLLRRRSDRGLRAADGDPRRRHRADQPRQPGRVHHPRAGREGDRAHRLARPSSSTGRCRRTTRPSASPTSPGPRTLLGWEPTVALEAGAEEDHRLFRRRCLPGGWLSRRERRISRVK